MYDTRERTLKQLSLVDVTKDSSEFDMEYLGSHEVITKVLNDFVGGWIVRGNLSRRPDYSGQKVLDMSKIRMDFARNEISDRSFVCLDYEFFKETPKPEPTPVDGAAGDGEEVKDEKNTDAVNYA